MFIVVDHYKVKRGRLKSGGWRGERECGEGDWGTGGLGDWGTGGLGDGGTGGLGDWASYVDRKLFLLLNWLPGIG